MKFIDLIKEDYLSRDVYRTPEQKKEEKRYKTIFRALKNGTVKIRHPKKDDEVIEFRYEINNPVFYRWQVAMGKEYLNIITNTLDGVTIYTDNGWVMSRNMINKESVVMDHLKYMIKSSITNIFANFDVNIHVNESSMMFMSDRPTEPLNEEIDDSKSRKNNKYIRYIYDTYKTGELKADRSEGEIHYAYQLSDDKIINIFDDETIVSARYMKIMYLNELAGKYGILPLMDAVKRRFANANIRFEPPRTSEFLTVIKWEEPKKLTPEEKKIKNVYKSLRKGIVTSKGTGIISVDKEEPKTIKYRYELNDRYKYINHGKNSIPIIVVNTIPGERLKIYEIQPDGKEVFLDKNKHLNSFTYNKVFNLIVLKFQIFNIALR